MALGDDTAANEREEVVVDSGTVLGGILEGLAGTNITDRLLNAGNNSDGNWIKLAAGNLMLCYGTILVDSDGGTNYSGNHDFPVQFVGNAPQCFISPNSNYFGTGSDNLNDHFAFVIDNSEFYWEVDFAPSIPAGTDRVRIMWCAIGTY